MPPGSAMVHNPEEKDYVGINAACSLLLAVVPLSWMARVDRCHAGKTHADRPPTVGEPCDEDTVGTCTETF